MADSSPDDISAQAELKAGQKRAGAERSNARQRASLACVPCRSKHVKCDGLLPSCTRCKEEGKKCRYVNSRRGIRDPNKRNSRDESLMTDQDDMTESTPSPSLPGSDIQTPQTRVHTARLHRHPISLYYANFHVAHSWLPPRITLQICSDAKPADLRFLMAVVSYIGSLYSESGGDLTLRQQAYDMFCEDLPLTIWSVQALLSLSVAAFGQLDDYSPIFERACQLARILQLQHKRTADGYKNPILAESCRRTYWGLYIHKSLLAIPTSQVHSLLFPMETNSGTELPCEEWEYDTGNIPVSVSLEEYNRSDPSRDFSSWAYFIDLIRIRDRSVIPFLRGLGKTDLFLNTTNQQIDSWRLRLKNWKKDRVDDDGMVDTILYHALGVSFGLQIQIQRHLQHAQSQSGHRQIDCGGHSSFYASASLAHPDYNMNMETDTSLPLTIQTPLRLVSLFNSRLIPERLSPACVLELESAVIPLVDSLCDNEGRQDYRDKTNFLAANLRKSGEFWLRSREVLERMYQRRGEVEQSKQLQHLTAVTEALSSTISLVDSYLWPMPSATGLVGGWPDLTSQPMRSSQTERGVISWSEAVPQAFYTGVQGAGISAEMRSSYSHFETKAGSVEDGSGTSSPHIKAEIRWN